MMDPIPQCYIPDLKVIDHMVSRRYLKVCVPYMVHLVEVALSYLYRNKYRLHAYKVDSAGNIENKNSCSSYNLALSFEEDFRK